MTEKEACERIRLLEGQINSLVARLSLPTTKDLDDKINELNTANAKLRVQITAIGAQSDKLESALRQCIREKALISNKYLTLVRENSSLKNELAKIKSEIPVDDKDLLLVRMAEFSAQEIENQKKEISDKVYARLMTGIKSQILSNMEIMTPEKRFEFFQNCSTIFGNVPRVNRILPEIKEYLKKLNREDKAATIQLNSQHIESLRIDNSEINNSKFTEKHGI